MGATYLELTKEAIKMYTNSNHLYTNSTLFERRDR